MVIIKVKLELKMEKMGIKVADITGELEIDVLVEELAAGIVVEELIDTFKEKDLEGNIYINNEKHTI